MRLLRAMTATRLALSAALRAPARLATRGRALHATSGLGAGCGGVFEDVTALVCNTPVVKISDKLSPPGVEVYAKCEYFNPARTPLAPFASAPGAPRDRLPRPASHPSATAEAIGERRDEEEVLRSVPS